MRREADAQDPALLTARARAGLDERQRTAGDRYREDQRAADRFVHVSLQARAPVDGSLRAMSSASLRGHG